MKAWRAPILSPAGLLVRACLIALAYGAAHLCGLRAYASILSGTAPAGLPADRFATGLGVVYVFLHFAFVIGAPILILAAGFLRLFARRAIDQPS